MQTVVASGGGTGKDWLGMGTRERSGVMETFLYWSTWRLHGYACMHAKLLQSCLTLCDPIYRRPPGSSVHQFSSVQSLSRVRLFATPWIAELQASLSITNSQSSPKPMSIESVMPSNISSSVVSFSSCLQSLTASEFFPMSQLFAWGGQSTGVSASASFIPKKSQSWSSEWTGWISLQSKGLSRVFSSTTFQKHQFFGTQVSSQSNSHIHTWPLEKP